MKATLVEVLEACKKALGNEDPGAMDAPAARMLEALGHPVPEPFGPHREAFLGALAQALRAERNESRFRAVMIARFALLAGSSDPPCYESGDDWTGVPLDREWLVPRWCPANRVSIVTGDPGQGKSRLLLQLCVALARGVRDWLPGGGPELGIDLPSVAVFVSYEDEEEEFRRKLYRMDLQADVRDRFRYVRPRGPVWAPDPQGSRHTSTAGELTVAGSWVRDYCAERGARLLVLDPKAAVFGCNENDRALVRDFAADWDLWAQTARCTVLLISHPPKGDSDYSGSTDWEGAPRAMWVLGTQDTGTGQEVREGRRAQREPAPAPQLRCRKVSYAAKPAPLWLSGYPTWRVSPPDRAASEWAESSGGADAEQDTGTESTRARVVSP